MFSKAAFGPHRSADGTGQVSTSLITRTSDFRLYCPRVGSREQTSRMMKKVAAAGLPRHRALK